MDLNQLPPNQNNIGWVNLSEENFNKEFPENQKLDEIKKRKHQKMREMSHEQYRKKGV